EQIVKLASHSREKGYTIVALELYFRQGRAKVDIGMAKGKQEWATRYELREKQDLREAQRALSLRLHRCTQRQCPALVPRHALCLLVGTLASPQDPTTRSDTMSFALHRLPLRLASGGFILNSGIGKLSLDSDTAKGLQQMAINAIPQLEQLSPEDFGKYLAAG